MAIARRVGEKDMVWAKVAAPERRRQRLCDEHLIGQRDVSIFED